MAGRVGDTMKTSTAVTCMKTLMMVFNIYFFMSGLAILFLGVWVKVDMHNYLEVSSSNSSNSAWLLIGVGLCVIVVGALGCCCTIKGISALLYAYGFILMLIFLLDLAVSISAFVLRGKIQEELDSGLKTKMNKYGNDKDVRNDIDKRQETLKCCGSKSYADWFSIDWTNKGNGTTNATQNAVPDSCCKEEKNCDNSNLPQKPGDGTQDIYTDGCGKKVSQFLEENFAIIGGLAIAFCFIQLFGALVACCLGKNINKAKYEQVA